MLTKFRICSKIYAFTNALPLSPPYDLSGAILFHDFHVLFDGSCPSQFLSPVYSASLFFTHDFGPILAEILIFSSLSSLLFTYADANEVEHDDHELFYGLH